MIISELGLRFLKSIENFSNKAYHDVNGWAICFGNRRHPDGRIVLSFDKVEFSADSHDADNYINTHLKNNVYFRVNNINKTLKQNEFDAICSFVYNIGHLPKSLKNAVEGGKLDEIQNAFYSFNHCKVNGSLVVSDALTQRRKQEFSLYSTGTISFKAFGTKYTAKTKDNTNINTNISSLIIEIAKSQIGVTEDPLGSNMGPQVNKYLDSTQTKPSSTSYWCMAFVYWVYEQACEKLGIPNPLVRTALVMGQWNSIKNAIKATKSQEHLIIPGSIFIIDHGHGKGHAGIIISKDNGYVVTIEGNTNQGGNRNGFGVFQRRRKISSLAGIIIVQNLLKQEISNNSISVTSEKIQTTSSTSSNAEIESYKTKEFPKYRIITMEIVGGCTVQEFIDANSISLTPKELMEYGDYDNNKAILASYKSDELKKYDNTASEQLIGFGAKIGVPYNNLSSKSVYSINQTLTLNQSNNAFVESGIKKLLFNPNYKKVNASFSDSGDLYGKTVSYKVFLWSKAIDPTGSTIMDISRFIMDISTDSNHNGGSFSFTLPNIVFNTKADFTKMTLSDLYCSEHEGEYLYRQIFQKESLFREEQFNHSDKNVECFFDDNDEFSKNDYRYFKRNSSFFDVVLQANDIVFIRMETLESDKDELSGDIMISSNNIAEKMYDVIGLIDSVIKTNNSSNSESVVRVSGRDFSKALIDDGVYFFDLEYAVEDREQIIKNSSKNKCGNRLIIPPQSKNKDEYDSHLQKNLSSIVGDTTFNFLQTQSIEEWLTFIFSQLTNIEICPEELFNGYKEKTFIITRDISEGSFEYKRSKAAGIWNICKLAIDPEVGNRRIADTSFTTASGSILNLVRKIAQPPFIEFYMDTYGDSYYFICRKPPYSEQSFKSNVCLNVFEQDVLSDQLQFGTDFYTWYKLNPAGSMLETTNNSSLMFLPAVMFPEYMEVWGSKVLDITTQFLDFDMSQSDQSETNLDNIRKQGQQDLDWLIETNAYLPFVRDGVITIKPDRRIKRGMNIRYFPTGEIFHVDGVSHSRSTSNQISGSTTLHVSRGMVETHMDKYFSLINLLRKSKNTGNWDKDTWTVNQDVFNFLLQRKQML